VIPKRDSEEAFEGRLVQKIADNASTSASYAPGRSAWSLRLASGSLLTSERQFFSQSVPIRDGTSVRPCFTP
jgi:hypothetical protein